MDRRSFLAGGLTLWAMTPQIAAAQTGWVLLGSRTIRWTLNRESIPVSRARGRFSQLRFEARGSDIFITEIEVFFARGRSERLPVFVNVRRNLPSNVIRLRGREQEIRRVDVIYRRPIGRLPARTTLELFGR